MLNIIWSLLVAGSIVCAVCLGTTQHLSAAFADSAADAVQLLLTLAGVMCLWSGLMKIAERSGLTAILSKLFAPLLHGLFPRLDKNSAAFEAISMNLTANLLGLGNTATPAGLNAMRELHRMDGSETASDEMVVFVVMNTASLQLFPAMLGTLRAGCGSASPFEILPSVWISSAVALGVALTISIVGNRLSKRRPAAKSLRKPLWS